MIEGDPIFLSALYTGKSLMSEHVRVLVAADRPLSFDEVVAGITRHTTLLQRSAVKGMLARLSHGGVVEVDRVGKKRLYSIAPAFRLDTEPADEFSLGLKDVSQQIQTVADLQAVLGAFGIQDAPPSRILQIVDEIANEKNQRLRRLYEDMEKYMSIY